MPRSRAAASRQPGPPRQEGQGASSGGATGCAPRALPQAPEPARGGRRGRGVQRLLTWGVHTGHSGAARDKPWALTGPGPRASPAQPYLCAPFWRAGPPKHAPAARLYLRTAPSLARAYPLAGSPTPPAPPPTCAAAAAGTGCGPPGRPSSSSGGSSRSTRFRLSFHMLQGGSGVRASTQPLLGRPAARGGSRCGSCGTGTQRVGQGGAGRLRRQRRRGPTHPARTGPTPGGPSPRTRPARASPSPARPTMPAPAPGAGAPTPDQVPDPKPKQAHL